jgi:hypothetical protein
MHAYESINALDLNDDAVLHDEISAMFAYQMALVINGYPFLAGEREAFLR